MIRVQDPVKTFGDFRAGNISFGVLYGIPIRLRAERTENEPAPPHGGNRADAAVARGVSYFLSSAANVSRVFFTLGTALTTT